MDGYCPGPPVLKNGAVAEGAQVDSTILKNEGEIITLEDSLPAIHNFTFVGAGMHAVPASEVMPAAPVISMIRLIEACRELRVGEKFGYPIELIGSALHKPDPRDYDLRILMSDEDFHFHFAIRPAEWQKEGREGKAWSEPRLTWSLRCTEWSKRLSERSGCNVDFQVWPRSFMKGASFMLVPL